jgi:hypothetical protein
MVALAGFGGGLIALFFAGQQLTQFLADPILMVQYWTRGADFTGGAIAATQISGDGAGLDLRVEIVNQSDNICSLWQVVVSASTGVSIEGFGIWERLADGRVSHQAGPQEALYPESPLPMNVLRFTFSPEALSQDIAGERRWSGRLTTTIITQRRRREQSLDIQIVQQEPPVASG